MKENKVRIIQLIDSLEPGGAERMALNYANILNGKIEFSGIVVSRKEGGLKECLNEKVSYLFLNKKKVFDLKALFLLKKFVEKNRVEFIHAHSSSFFLAFLLKLIKPKLKVIWHDHYGNSEFLEKRNSIILKFISFFFYKIIVVNNLLLEWNKNKLFCTDVVYLPNFPDLNQSENKKETKLEGVEGKRVICLANLRPQKNHELLLRIASLSIKKYKDWTYHLVGKDFNDDYSAKLKFKIRELKLQDHVFIYGSRNDISNVLSQSSIGIFTSISEGLPVALLEIGLNRIPIISSNVGDIKNVIKNRVNSVLMPTFDERDFYDELKIMFDNEELRIEYGIKLEREIRDGFLAESIVKKYLNFINVK